jgi:CRP-like cAMP-binding protein
MSDRIQFNVRLDKHPDLYEAIKGTAEEQGVTLNEFALRAFQQALGWEVEHHSPVLRTEIEEMLASQLAPMQRRLEELEARLGESKA